MQTHCLNKSWGREPPSDASLILTSPAREERWIVGDSRQGDGLWFEVRAQSEENENDDIILCMLDQR